MDMRPLGSTGLVVSAIGLGTVKLGRNRGVKYPGGEGFALPSDDDAAALLRTARELGINLIDTAPAYGASEERLGELMARERWFGGRDAWVVCTKAGEEFDAGSGASYFDFSPASVRASVERSLRRLRVDVLDVVLLHSDGRDEWIKLESGALEELRRLKARGLVRAVGMSTKTPDGGLLAVRECDGGGGGACDVVMVTFNPRHRREEIVIDAARHRRVGVLVKKALLSGHLDDLGPLLPSELRNQPPALAALRLAVRKPGVSSVVVGTTSPERLRDNAAAGSETTRPVP